MNYKEKSNFKYQKSIFFKIKIQKKQNLFRVIG